jgi:hypothetical protein
MSNWLERFLIGHRYSYITTEFPDRHQFPKFYEAKRTEIILEPGDMLLIPPGWYHWVFSEEPDQNTGLNVAINYWYKDIWDITHLDRDPPIKTTHNIHKTLDYMNFLKTLGDEKLYCSSSNTGCFTLPSARWIQNDTIKCEDNYLNFNEFYKKRTSDEHWYLWGFPDGRLKSYDPKLNPEWELSTSNWWVNFGNVDTAMHYDGANNLLCQISGKKRVVLFPHSEWSKLYLINPYPPEFIHYILQSEQQRRQIQ